MENYFEEPFFSVIIPTYNRAHSLTSAIKSILNQTFKNFEIIIIDDASIDNTEEVVKLINDTRIHYLKNEVNRERCLSRNLGIDNAKGKYVCFLDSDDYHLPNHLEVIYSEIQSLQNPIAFLFTNSCNEDSNGKRSERCCPDFENFNSYTYFLHYTVNPQRWAVHKTIFEKINFDNEILICEDMDTSLRILAAGYPIYQIKEITTVYVAAIDSFTVSDTKKAEKELFYLKRIFSRTELIDKLITQEKNRLLSMCYFHLAIKANERIDKLNVLKFSIKSFFLFPKGYNGKTNKILIVMCIYSIPLIGFLARSINNIKKK